jgi:hypothetical protein
VRGSGLRSAPGWSSSSASSGVAAAIVREECVVRVSIPGRLIVGKATPNQEDRP